MIKTRLWWMFKTRVALLAVGDDDDEDGDGNKEKEKQISYV